MAEKLKGAGKRAAAQAGTGKGAGKGKTDPKRNAKDAKAQVAKQTALEQAAAKKAEAGAQPGFVFGFLAQAKIGALKDKLDDNAADKASMDRLRGKIGKRTQEIEEELGLDRRGVQAAVKICDMEEQERTAYLSAMYVTFKARGLDVEIVYRNGALANASRLAATVAGGASNGKARPAKAANGNGGANGHDDQDRDDAPPPPEAIDLEADAKGRAAGLAGKNMSGNPFDFETSPKNYEAWKQGWMAGQQELGAKFKQSGEDAERLQDRRSTTH